MSHSGRENENDDNNNSRYSDGDERPSKSKTKTYSSNSNSNSVDESIDPNSKANYTINIAVLGDSKSGKSSLVECFLTNEFNPNKVFSNDILVIKAKKMNINNINFKLCFFEFSGNINRDKDLMVENLPKCHAYLICNHFNQIFDENIIRKWLNLLNSTNINKYPIYLVGTKYDLELLELYNKNQFEVNNEDEQMDKVDKNEKIKENDKKDDFKLNRNVTNLSLMGETQSNMKFEDHIRNFVSINGISKFFNASSFMNIGIEDSLDQIVKTSIIQYVSSMKEDQVEIEEKFKCTIF